MWIKTNWLFMDVNYERGEEMFEFRANASMLPSSSSCSSIMLRRFRCFSTSPPHYPLSTTKRRLVFLGSPQVSASVLDALFNSASAPDSIFEETFLSNFKALEPELCITAAYGNILPTKFLQIPPLGTVNIHPSLLPLYRGAAPVQRALQDGVKETGVSVAYTVRQLDAGPVN